MTTEQVPEADKPYIQSDVQFVPPGTLGRIAVWLEDSRMYNLGSDDSDDMYRLGRHAKQHPKEHYWQPATPVEVEQDLPFALHNIRDEIKGYSDLQKQFLNTYLDHSVPVYLSEQRPVAQSRLMPWEEWLANESNATDDQLLNLLQWNVFTVAELNAEPVIHKFGRLYRTEYEAAVKRWIAHGYVAGHALDGLQNLETTRVSASDFFSTNLRGAHAGYSRNSKTIYLEHGLGKTKLERVNGVVASMNSSLFHEFTHCVFPGFTSCTWLNEATATYISDLLQRDIPNKALRPINLSNPKTIYIQERLLTGKLLAGGSDDIPVVMVTRAFSSQFGSKERADLENALTSSWQTSGSCLEAVNLAVITRMEKHVAKGVLRTIALGRASMEVLQLLKNRPEEIFGAGYVRPVKRQTIS